MNKHMGFINTFRINSQRSRRAYSTMMLVIIRQTALKRSSPSRSSRSSKFLTRNLTTWTTFNDFSYTNYTPVTTSVHRYAFPLSPFVKQQLASAHASPDTLRHRKQRKQVAVIIRK